MPIAKYESNITAQIITKINIKSQNLLFCFLSNISSALVFNFLYF